MIDRFARAAQADLVAVDMGENIQPPLEMGDILVVIADQQHRGTIIIQREGFLHAIECGLHRSRKP